MQILNLLACVFLVAVPGLSAGETAVQEEVVILKASLEDRLLDPMSKGETP